MKCTDETMRQRAIRYLEKVVNGNWQLRCLWSLCLKPKLTRKTKREARPPYNNVAVCITEDEFVASTNTIRNKRRKKRKRNNLKEE